MTWKVMLESAWSSEIWQDQDQQIHADILDIVQFDIGISVARMLPLSFITILIIRVFGSKFSILSGKYNYNDMSFHA